MSSEASFGGALSGASEVAHRSRRLLLVGFVFLVPWIVIVARLWFLQLERGPHYQSLASGNFVRESDITPDRGRIFDAKGRVLAENRPSYDIMASPNILFRNKDVPQLLATKLPIDKDKLERLIAASETGAGAEIVVRRDVPRDQVAVVETWKNELPGIYLRISQRRYYPFDSLAAHTIGYVSGISEEEARSWESTGYTGGDQVGRTGLERWFESILRGAPGLERNVVDVRGVEQSAAVANELLGSLRRVEPVPGQELVLTLDADLTQIADDAMARTPSGGLVALDPRDGSILALYSKPGFNLNAWSGRLSNEEKRRIDNDPFKPMLNKVTSSYFPGSTYKVVTAMAGLEEGLVNPRTEVDCSGVFHYGNRDFRCWNRTGHGEVNLSSSLAASCDIYFYGLGVELGMDRLARYATEFGFGELSGVTLPGESAGLVPTKAWHETHSDGGFQFGFAVNTSVGQGDVRTTPLQLALTYAALANGGSLYYPRLVDRIQLQDGTAIYEYPRKARRQLPFKPENIRQVMGGLRAVLNTEEGTAHEYRLSYLEAAGKTGTAQVRALDTARMDGAEALFADRDHAWFVAVAPADDPRIVVSVFVEHGGHGASAAAPVAMKVIDRYFREVLGMDEAVTAFVDGSDRTRLHALLHEPKVAPVGLPSKVSGEPGVPMFRSPKEGSGSAPEVKP
jgi:penicillin-binding protein 2